MNSIFIVLLGDRYEGYTILSVRSSFNSAQKFCIDFIENDDLGPTIGEWIQRSNDYWYREHDYLSIMEKQVEE